MIGYRNSVLAAKAWHNEKHCHKKHCHLSDLKNGFMQGYSDVATGSDGCVPAVAPRSYMGWKYQTPDGQARVNAWFEGYPLGVRAAERDGVGNWGQIRPMGMNSASAITNQYPAYVEDSEEESPFYEEGDQRYQPIPDPASDQQMQMQDGPEQEDTTPKVDEASPVSPADVGGLGESIEEVKQVMRDLREHNCDMLTLGQYLQPSKYHLAVERYITPKQFAAYKKIATDMGFSQVASGPMVRSSYHADLQAAGKSVG